MTKKRFKKLMMSKGYSRNAANEIIKETLNSGRTYAEIYAMSNINISCIIDAFKKSVEQLQKVVKATAKAITAFSAAYCEAMKEGNAGND